MAFATTDELEDWVQGDVPGATAEQALERASASVVSAAGVPIVEAVNDEVVLDSPGGVELQLPNYPVTAVASVEVDGEDPGYWEWSRTGRLARTSGWHWPVGLREVTVTYTHGYPDADIPDPIKTVTLAVAARMVANPQSLQQFNEQGASFPVGANVLVTALTPDERRQVVEAIR